MKLYFGVFLEKTPNHFGLGKATVTKFLYKETALAWGNNGVNTVQNVQFSKQKKMLLTF